MQLTIKNLSILLFSILLLAGGLFAQSTTRSLSPADQAEAGKKMTLMFAIDNRISQIKEQTNSEIQQLQAQNAKNRADFEEWQKSKRKEYAASPEQSITIELQWSPPPKPATAAKETEAKKNGE